jgi:hypothetical protein
MRYAPLVLPGGLFPQHKDQIMVRKKKAYRVVKPLPDDLGAVLIGGTVLGPGEDVSPDADKKSIKDCLERELIEEVSVAKPVSSEKQVATAKKDWRKRLRPVSKWNINPVDLVGKTLVELNIMILEKDPDADAFGDLNEALEYLSKDYEG